MEMDSNVRLKVVEAAMLMGKDVTTIRDYCKTGKISSEIENGTRGRGGITYRIPLSALPAEAQLKYYASQSVADPGASADLVSYKARIENAYGKEAANNAMTELLDRQQAVREVGGMLETSDMPKNKCYEMVAERHGTTARTLRRWQDSYNGHGLSGLMRSERQDKGRQRSMCLEARRFICEQYLAPARRTQNDVFDKLLDRVAELGADACGECPYNPASANHLALMNDKEAAPFYPACDTPGSGIIPPGNRYAVNRLVKQIPESEIKYMRSGRKAWEAAYMAKATRAKPDTVNMAWYGDHHQFDVFVIDENGKAVRPWLTAWYDIGSGVMAGWCISTNPNSETIAEAFARGVAVKKNSPICGVPAYVYVDNGKDYRGERFEGGKTSEYELGALNAKLNQSGILTALCVEVKHAKPYHGWAKPVERWFRTLEEKYCKEIAGYCGGSAEHRPENFERMLKSQFERGELLTLDELTDVFINEILPAYHNRPHEGYNGEIPMERYNRLPKARNEIVSWQTLSIIKTEKAERKVKPEGIRFNNVLYWNWSMTRLIGSTAVIRYNRGDYRSITVCDANGYYVCEAEPKELLGHIEPDTEKVARHVEMQKRQEQELRRSIRAKGVRLPGKRASGNMFYEMVDEQASGTITDVNARRAAQGKKELAEQRKEREAEANESVRSMFRARGEALLGSK